MKVTQSCLALCNSMDCPWNSPGQNTGVGSLSLLQGILPTQGSIPGLPHHRQILYQLSHKGSPKTLEQVANSFSRGSSRPRNQTGVSCITSEFFTSWAIPRNQTGVSCITGEFFTSWAIREAPLRQQVRGNVSQQL